MGTTLSMQCSTCGQQCADGTYYIKDGAVRCVSCAVAGMPMVTQPPAPLVGTESKQEQVLPVEAQRLYEAARALSTKCLELAAKELTAVPPSLDGIAVSLELSERLVRLAHSLDLLADKVTARGY